MTAANRGLCLQILFATARHVHNCCTCEGHYVHKCCTCECQYVHKSGVGAADVTTLPGLEIVRRGSGGGLGGTGIGGGGS